MKTKKVYLAILSFFLMTSFSFAADLILTGNLDSDWYYINGSIYTQNSTTIADGKNLDLIAKEAITFKPGFTIHAGGKLSAKVSPDTDLDGILDIVEDRTTCLNSSIPDTDTDGLLDGEEDANHNGIWEAALNETNACNKDTDGDLIDDKWEG